MTTTPFTATAVWLRRNLNRDIEVLVEIGGLWRSAIVAERGFSVGVIAEGNSVESWPLDTKSGGELGNGRT